MVIDDEIELLDSVSRALRASGFTVDAAADGVRGLGLACAGTYDLMLVDLVLPGLDGASVLRDVITTNPDQKVIVLSALSDVETKIHCLDLGALDYLVKPVALAELVARIRARLRQGPAAAADRILRAGELQLDLERRRVDTPTGTVALATREFLLLAHLMRRQHEVCSREELLDAVWGYQFDPGTNVVEVYVGRLRAKVGSRVIETVRNVGYCFVGA